ncbi:ExbD/TolR family protein [Pseudoponticoccus marisrubri]|uniref:Biopolymer transporter ExbD n=1 Tax=Pseudoponticoccus marisrubri TaxID=1685382 RepID=A0A0W7WKU6_9RHOB|nr:biopolymer transporter ExbD [Pseudoponticoccus marisrubri]KUF11237.1 hypothetical protein AVJ23_09320 [Pseudoponticoccus marisrubri]
MRASQARWRVLPPARRPSITEPVVPMINVALLLLIFFVMTARLAPPDPFSLALPDTEEGRVAPEGAALYLSRDGALAFGTTRGEEALTAAVAAGPVRLQADARAEAALLAQVLARLAAAGAQEVALISLERRP